MPETKIFTSLISAKLINTSLPKNAEFTLDLISKEASFRDNPATTIFPISGRLIEPSPLKEIYLYSYLCLLIVFVICLQCLMCNLS